jgi:hypothetical protein
LKLAFWHHLDFAIAISNTQLMPYKHNESRRHKIKKSRYKVTNWHDYNNGLRQRGDFTIWFTEEAIFSKSHAPNTLRMRFGSIIKTVRINCVAAGF